ncbi:DUF2141 domain-containing protein [Tahibacter amnicola]|uniref:DUF2141 domain-containing protein n=1 Tax=Tahibacter amnicola TaxID=2976241 RepID=A0ABY6B9M8_9GAMM|nr:DUF2141 domain-containing protein [Tahibacter amnicola]UXI66773.1 DUF2141 domain-containing protein [Tahibacter amnicola]
MKLVSALAFLFGAATAAAADLTVTISAIRAQEGKLSVMVVDSADGWDRKAEPVAKTSLTPDAKTATVKFPGLKAGSYAVSVIHDENGNGKFDKNMWGMPTEGYGSSNNPHVMRRPYFEEARFEMAEPGKEVTIDLQ